LTEDSGGAASLALAYKDRHAKKEKTTLKFLLLVSAHSERKFEI